MRRFAALGLVSTLLVAPAAGAEPGAGPATPIRSAIGKVRFASEAPAKRYYLVQPARTNSAATKASAAIAVGFLGFFAGAWTGAMLQPNCRCQDQGLTGAVIGAPIGAVLGAIAGWRLAAP